MLFNSQEFMLFLPFVILVYGVAPKKCRRLWLLLASYYFYMSWNITYGLLLASVTLLTYWSALLLEKTAALKTRRNLLWGCIVVNLSILAFFKYADFIMGNISFLVGRFGIRLHMEESNILLPVGISFYIFQAVGYLIDVYRKDIEAEKSMITYALFVSFFPQLVAGPIERSRNLMTQIKKIEHVNFWNWERMKSGSILILYGLFLKIVIADRAAILVDQVFGEYYRYGTIELCIAAFIFAIQVYCDFGGYSIIAQGAAKLAGIELMDNFNAPYFSKSIKEFWGRWHISLSTWLRDYLYIPLGGSRCNALRKYWNYMVTFLVSGLWHGAQWTFIFWGGGHGFCMIAGIAFAPVRKKCRALLCMKENVFSNKLLRTLGTFILVDFAWIFFRADSMKAACAYISRIVHKWNPWVLTDGGLFKMGFSGKEWFVFLCAVLVLFLVDLLKYYKNEGIVFWIQKQNLWFQWLFFWILLFGTVIFGVYGPGLSGTQFLYFQF